MTLIELMIVIAIVGLIVYVMRVGFNRITKADLVEDIDELAAMLRRANQLAIETGEQHRVVFDFDQSIYRIEVCQGQAALARNEAVHNDDDKTKQAIEKGQDRLRDLPQDALAVGDPDEAVRRAKAIAGHHIADRTCAPATSGISGVAHGTHKRVVKIGDTAADWVRNLNVASGIRFSEIWVQHRDGSVKKGDVAVYFFPNGSAEKAVIELEDPDHDVRTVMVNGLTGRITQKSGKLDDVDQVMLRNAIGGKEKERENQK